MFFLNNSVNLSPAVLLVSASASVNESFLKAFLDKQVCVLFIGFILSNLKKQKQNSNMI